MKPNRQQRRMRGQQKELQMLDQMLTDALNKGIAIATDAFCIELGIGPKRLDRVNARMQKMMEEWDGFETYVIERKEAAK